MISLINAHDFTSVPLCTVMACFKKCLMIHIFRAYSAQSPMTDLKMDFMGITFKANPEIHLQLKQ